MLSEYEALSILMYMEIFLSQILNFVNDILNIAIRRMYLQPCFRWVDFWQNCGWVTFLSNQITFNP